MIASFCLCYTATMDDEYFAFIDLVISELDRLEIPYAIGGSFASGIYGEPRMTYDIDMSIQLQAEKLTALIHFFENRKLNITRDAARKALINGGDFQASDSLGGYKVDFYATPSRLTPRQQRVFERRRRLPYGFAEKTAWFMSPEDVILYKLDWYVQGKSEKHIRDIGAILSSENVTIDSEYIERWISEIQAESIWERIRLEQERRQSDANT